MGDSGWWKSGKNIKIERRGKKEQGKRRRIKIESRRQRENLLVAL